MLIRIYKGTDAILQSNDLNYADRIFEWKVKIIKDDNVINAFAAPRGLHVFLYRTIKTLDNEAQFAGVMAHEMAHADGHSTEVITKQYRFDLLLSTLLGTIQLLVEILAKLATGATG